MIRNDYLNKMIQALPLATDSNHFQVDFYSVINRLKAAEKILADVTEMNNVTDLGAATNFDKVKALAQEHLEAIK